MEFFRFVDRAMSSQRVSGFPDVGLTYLERHQPPAGHPHFQLSKQLTRFIQSLAPLPADVRVRQHIIETLCRRIREALGQFPHGNLIVVPCGSCLSGTFLPEADIDLVLYQYPTPCNAPQVMDHLCQQLEDFMLVEPNSFQRLPQARIPILKFAVDPGIQIDLTIDELQGPLNVISVCRLFAAFPILLPTQLFLKCLLYIHELDQPYTGGISAYTLHLMLIAYLQHRGEAPFVSEFICGFCKFYGSEFNFTLTGIDVKGSGRFFSRFDEGKLSLDSPETMYIVDPLNPRNVLGLNAFRMNRIREVFRETCDAIGSGDAAKLLDQFQPAVANFNRARRVIAEFAQKLGQG
jgi:DNA polymerase sigma